MLSDSHGGQTIPHFRPIRQYTNDKLRHLPESLDANQLCFIFTVTSFLNNSIECAPTEINQPSTGVHYIPHHPMYKNSATKNSS